jgi:hypothetical protein
MYPTPNQRLWRGSYSSPKSPRKIKETLPAFDKTPQPLEGGGTAVAYHPGKNSSLQGN